MTPTDLTGAADRLKAEAAALDGVDTPEPSANGQVATARMYLALAAQAMENAALHLSPAPEPVMASEGEAIPNA